MNTTTFVIDESRLSGLVKRLQYNLFSRVAIIGITVLSSQYFSYGSRDLKAFALSFCITTPLVLLIIGYSSGRKFRRTYKTLKVVLNEEGVEVKAEGMPYKMINWADLIVKEHPNGTIDLFDNTVSNLSGRWSGKGWIRIQPEIADRANLLSELAKRSQTAF
ncbi:hypothetical protein LX99_04954 [Mucilaginibacter oryzae]|uniref:YcxB-like protein n=1 Tax=Mucilaginibacter oryzae TaxID=468058 RepID=A0A316GTT3_9SPHI|nr:hypothetical protein [Mucilaginibacter oryzae]PWK67096.1 hypothetical protein LX99_04954 [Mucilaginibacter oryzae]